MLTVVEARNRQGALLALPLDDISDGLVLAEVEGLDPVKATIVSSSFAGADGSQYLSARREDRNVKLVVELQPDYITTSVRDLRKRLYNYFMTKAEVNLRFYDSDGLIVEIWGRVESCETALFTQEPTVNVSIICFDPDFLDLNPIQMNGMTSASTTDEAGKLHIPYAGTVEAGVKLVLNVDRPLTEFTLYHNPPDGTTRQMDFAESLVAGDVLTISTVFGSKYATLTRAGNDTPILYGISPQSNWIELMQGDNDLRLYAAGAAIPFNITYTTRYGGL